MAYICEDCGAIFFDAEEKRYIQRSGEEMDPPTYHCPKCHSEFFEEVAECKICGEHHPLREMNGEVCDECVANIAEKIKNLLVNGLTSDEVEIMKDKIELGDVFNA